MEYYPSGDGYEPAWLEQSNGYKGDSFDHARMEGPVRREAQQSFISGPVPAGLNASLPGWGNGAMDNTLYNRRAYGQADLYRIPAVSEHVAVRDNRNLQSSYGVSEGQLPAAGHRAAQNYYRNNSWSNVTYPGNDYSPGAMRPVNVPPRMSHPESLVAQGSDSATSAYSPPMASMYANPRNAAFVGSQPTYPERSQPDADYSVPCPYRCGTILRGVHALGNLTRHLKSQNCTESDREKPKYPCPIAGCGREYTRSDGLRVHMRRLHGAPPALTQDENVPEDEDYCKTSRMW